MQGDQQVQHLAGRFLGAVDVDPLVAPGDAHAHGGLDLPQVLIHRAAKVRQASVVVGVELVAKDHERCPQGR
jgi:hypothetical protein